MTVDSAGNIYVSDNDSSNVYKYSAGSYNKSTVATFDSPEALAVDSSGNVYVADLGSPTGNPGAPITGGGLFRVPYSAGSYGAKAAIGGSTFANGSAIAVALDSSGNLYASVGTATDSNGNTSASSLYKLTGSGTSWTPHLIDSTYFQATGITIDAAGNLYVSDDQGDDSTSTTPGAIYKETLVSGNTYTKSSYITSLNFPEDVVITKDANFYIPNSSRASATIQAFTK